MKTDPLRAYLAHQTPGRVRITIPAQRGDRRFFNRLAGSLAQSGQVRNARANAAAASVVLEHDGPFEALMPELERHALVFVPAGQAQQAGHGQATRPDRAAELGLPEPGLMYLAGAGFGAIGVAQALRGDIAIPAMSAFWYALSAFLIANRTVREIANATAEPLRT